MRIDRVTNYDRQVFFRGGYLFLQSIYYQLQMNKICRKLKQKYKFKYDINAILSDLVYARILEPCSKRSSYKVASEFFRKNHPMNFMISTGHWMYLVRNVILFSLKFTKTPTSLEKEMIRSFIMTARIITLKLNRKMEIKNTGKPSKNTDQTQSSKWDCLWMEMGFPLLFLFFREMQTDRTFSQTVRKESSWRFWLSEIYLLQRYPLALNQSGNTITWGNGLIS